MQKFERDYMEKASKVLSSQIVSLLNDSPLPLGVSLTATKAAFLTVVHELDLPLEIRKELADELNHCLLEVHTIPKEKS